MSRDTHADMHLQAAKNHGRFGRGERRELQMLKLNRVLAVVLIAGSYTAGVAAADWGNLTGTFVYDGTPPKPDPINVTKDVEVCGKEMLVNESLVVNPDNKGIADIMVYLYLSARDKQPTPHPDFEKTAADEVRIDNVGCRYEPRVVLLRTTQTLVVGNKDPIGHNTKIDTFANPPLNPIIPAGTEIKQKFPNPEKRPSQVGCNIHPWMSATLLVQDHPYMAVTDENGQFTIPNLPAGKWTFQVRHPSAGYITEVKVGGKSEKWSRGRMEMTIKAGENDLGVISVPAATFKK